MIVVSGPSCVGKSITVARLVQLYNYETVKALTSRRKRRNEADGQEYSFVNYSMLKELMAKDNTGFWDVPVKREIYGYLRTDIESAIGKEKVIIQSTSTIAIHIKKCFHNITLVFFDFQTEREQIRRMKKRFRDEAEIHYRLSHAFLERQNSALFDHVFFSDRPRDFVSLLEKQEILSY